ncbi:hypothetical protein BH20ACT2_BH20ACT2_17000 [soil metagenome]
MTNASGPPLSRRAVLLGGAGFALLAACGGSDDDGDSEASPDGEDDPSPEPADDGTRFNLISFFGGPVLVAGREQRAPFGVGDAEGVILGTDNVPESLVFEVSREGEAVGEPLEIARRGAEIPRPYFPVRFTPPVPGVYEVTTEIDGERLAPRSIQVSEAAEVPFPQPGDPMVRFDTPTVADARGVEPLCTREPEPCPFHDATLTEALAAGPVAFLIATPAYCATAICGPVVDVLMNRRAEFADRVGMVHAEVFASGEEAAANPAGATVAPAVRAYDLSFEPSMVLADAEGRVAERLDFIFDAEELQEALARLVS